MTPLEALKFHMSHQQVLSSSNNGASNGVIPLDRTLIFTLCMQRDFLISKTV